MNVDLAVDFAGVKLKNPVILASATPGWDGLRLEQAGKAGAAAVIPKTIGPSVEWAQHPRCGRMSVVRLGGKPMGMINLELFTTKSKEEWITTDLAIARRGGASVIGSIFAAPDPRKTGEMADEIANTEYVDMLEIYVSCPMPASAVGMHIGRDPAAVFKQVAAVRQKTSLPVMVKMTPNISDMVSVARACLDAGANALAISNSIRGFAGVNVDSGKPVLPAFGGYTGPAIKPVIQRFVAEVALAVPIPISAVGGIMTWRDAVEYIMLGASTIQVCTSVMWGQYGKIDKIVSGIREFMEEKGYLSIDDFKGIALRDIVTIEEYSRRPRKVAHVAHDSCKKCGICYQVCFYDAIEMSDGLPRVNADLCDGCGLCAEFCPCDKAISLRELDRLCTTSL